MTTLPPLFIGEGAAEAAARRTPLRETIGKIGERIGEFKGRVGERLTRINERIGDALDSYAARAERNVRRAVENGRKNELGVLGEIPKARKVISEAGPELLGRFDALESYKSGVVPSDPNVVVQVAAELEINGRTYRSYNSWAGRPRAGDYAARQQYIDAGFVNPKSGLAPVRAFTNHAEGGAFLQAFEAGERGGTATLYVTGKEVCGYCSNSFNAVMKALDLERLHIFERAEDGTIRTWTEVPKP